MFLVTFPQLLSITDEHSRCNLINHDSSVVPDTLTDILNINTSPPFFESLPTFVSFPLTHAVIAILQYISPIFTSSDHKNCITSPRSSLLHPIDAAVTLNVSQYYHH
jgi:hypothetical protein